MSKKKVSSNCQYLIFSHYWKHCLKHPAVLAHSLHLIIIIPPPVDEHRKAPVPGHPFEEKGRSAVHTKLYADAAREVGLGLGIPVCDLWSAMMAVAGWKRGSEAPLPGSLFVKQNAVLKKFLYDGESAGGSRTPSK